MTDQFHPKGVPAGRCPVGNKTGYLARCAAMVTSADKGAILEVK